MNNRFMTELVFATTLTVGGILGGIANIIDKTKTRIKYKYLYGDMNSNEVIQKIVADD